MSLKAICLLERPISVLFKWLNHNKASEEKDVVTARSLKACSIESRLGQKLHVSSLAK